MTQSNIVAMDNKSLVSTSIPTAITTRKTRDLNAKTEKKSWYLKKTNSRISSVEISFCSWCISYLRQWDDWLFYPSLEDSSTQINNIQIKGYNLKTNKTLIIYDVSQNTNDFQGAGKLLPYDVSDMQIIGNTLFFSLGGYLTPKGMFWVDLPPMSKPQKFSDKINDRIIYWKDRYWIIGGVGDGCWNITNYSLFDIDNKKIIDIAQSNSGCSQGEEYIGTDKKDRMILAFHNQDGIYQYVMSIPVDSASIREDIIEKQDMPKNITGISYLENTDQLLLRGDEIYMFDFSSNNLKRIDRIPLVPKDAPPINKEKTSEEIIKEITLPPEYEFVLE